MLYVCTGKAKSSEMCFLLLSHHAPILSNHNLPAPFCDWNRFVGIGIRYHCRFPFSDWARREKGVAAVNMAVWEGEQLLIQTSSWSVEMSYLGLLAHWLSRTEKKQQQMFLQIFVWFWSISHSEKLNLSFVDDWRTYRRQGRFLHLSTSRQRWGLRFLAFHSLSDKGADTSSC